MPHSTLLNPKALIFGLVLLPDTAPVTGLAAFCLLVIGVALLWAGLGAGVPRATGSTVTRAFRRASAC